MVQLNRASKSVIKVEQQLASCGLHFDPTYYVLVRRGSYTIVGSVTALLAWAGILHAAVVIVSLLIACFFLFDDWWFLLMKKWRAQRIIREIYTISNQLLYLQHSQLHIHTKLTRCIPYTNVLRTDFLTLLAEWYNDPDEALMNFKRRVGTDQAFSFAETISALRMFEHDRYYELLRERIYDYKESMDLHRESTKESGSYVLFVLAGLPIMYTFQLFIYPWVKEGQRMMESIQ